jgi:hypothetical protein
VSNTVVGSGGGPSRLLLGRIPCAQEASATRGYSTPSHRSGYETGYGYEGAPTVGSSVGPYATTRIGQVPDAVRTEGVSDTRLFYAEPQVR